MSSIPNSIAASVAQMNVQQGQISRARDAQHNLKQQQSDKMKQLLDEHLQSVEDSTQAESQNMRVKDEQRDAANKRRQQQSTQDADENEDQVMDQVELSHPTSSKQPVSNSKAQDHAATYRHLDLQA